MNTSFDIETYGPWAVVTGASSGIGESFAKELADKGFNLVLVARRQERLEQLASEIQSRHSVLTRVLVADLSTAEGAQQVIDQTDDLEIGLFICNAGNIVLGDFLARDFEQVMQHHQLNVLTPTRLAHHFGGRFKARKSGGILFVSSLAAVQGIAKMATYAAEKSYQLILGESIARELRPFGVDVSVLLPGPTDSEINSKMAAADGFNEKALPVPSMSAESVVRIALNRLSIQTVVVPGFLNRMTAVLGKHFMSRNQISWLWSTLIGRALPS